MTPNDISAQILDAAIKVHRELGPGCLNRLMRYVLPMNCGSGAFAFTRR